MLELASAIAEIAKPALSAIAFVEELVQFCEFEIAADEGDRTAVRQGVVRVRAKGRLFGSDRYPATPIPQGRGIEMPQAHGARLS